jgi:hypothetical protein
MGVVLGFQPELLGIGPKIPQEGLAVALDALLATGATVGEALGLAAQAFGLEATLPRLLGALGAPSAARAHGADPWGQGGAGTGQDPAVLTLDEVAAGHPGLALAGLLAWGQGRAMPGSLWLASRTWVTTLPPGLSVGRHLNLIDTGIATLPKGLLARSLDLDGTPLTTLPAGLWISRHLSLRRCRDWDGRIPEDARIGRKLLTDAHPDGIGFAEWRRLHPDGEGA